MNSDGHATFPEGHHNLELLMSPLMDFEDGDFAAMGSGASVASSEWRNVSSSSSSSSVEDQLTAKDIVNWRECWEVWSTHHPVITTDIRNISLAHPLCQDIHSIFQFAYSIPWSRFNGQSPEHNHNPDALQNFLTQVMEINPTIFSENASAYPQLSHENGLAIAGVALEVQHSALRLIQVGGDPISDDYWTTQVHDTLIVKCARGRLLKSSEARALQIQDRSYSQSGLGPAFAKILSVRRFQPHGAIVATSQAGVVASDQVLCADSNVPFCFAAVFSTRSQVVSQMRDTPESVALYSLSVMAISAVLSQMSTLGINLPVFGVMFDRNIVRLHVDWALDDHISVPLPQMSVEHLSTFREFDLTLPQDCLQVALILDALGAYAQCRLVPALRGISNIWQSTSQSISQHSKAKDPLLGPDEISSEEKVQAWMQNSAVAQVATIGICD